MQRGESHKSYKRASIKAYLLLQGLSSNMKISLLFVVLFVSATSVVNSKRRNRYDWNNYHSHKDINGFIDGLAKNKKANVSLP